MNRPQAIITDIEGTTSSISFVKEVLFPYARHALPGFVRDHGHEPQVRQWLEHVAAEIAVNLDQQDHIIQTLQHWIDEDQKHTALKALQGMIWQNGYRSGAYRAHVYPEVAQTLRRWYEQGIGLYVYSSGSVAAQKLFFSYSQAGDLTHLFSAYFDTQTGPKRDPASYARIIDTISIPAQQVLFLSDVVEELDAARSSGLQTTLIDRLADYPTPRLGNAANKHLRAEDFSQLGF